MNKENLMAIKKTISFIEELSWLFESNRHFDLKKAVTELKCVLDEADSIQNLSSEHKSPNPNKHFLIGVLPKLLQDERLFPANESIASFAKETLGIIIPRYEKKSRHELIGRIVCQTDLLSDTKLSNLVKALSIITGNDETIIKIQKERENVNFSWNKTIQKLTR